MTMLSGRDLKIPDAWLCEGDPTVFLLGVHQPGWLADARTADVPLFVSHRRLRDYRRLPRRVGGGTWALDSGAFSELAMFGEYRTTPRAYIAAVARYDVEVGQMWFAAPQDWMCEPFMIEKTGLTVAEHQRRTIESVIKVSRMWPEYSDATSPICPVLQGWTGADYDRHRAMYLEYGIDLADWPVVGLGSICRRQATAEIEAIVRAHSDLELHAFGCKVGGLRRFGHLLTSADSMAWSAHYRRLPPLPGCAHSSCANCLRAALAWRASVVALLDAPRQLSIDDVDTTYSGVAA